MSSVPHISSNSYTPNMPTMRKGCSCYQTPHYTTTTPPSANGHKKALIQPFTAMQLIHKSKDGRVKNKLSLSKIHHELESHSLILRASGASNTLLTTISFNCLIKTGSNQEIRDYLTFDLRIPGTSTTTDSVFSYDLVQKLYGSKKELYEALKHYYAKGRAIINPENHKHGHEPEYNHLNSKHDQYIRHTEQLLVAYLALPEASKMLSKRLITEIRGKYTDVTSVKIYNMGLHMHSTKTCCAPCEYSLIGLMNDIQGYIKRGKTIGFLTNFKNSSSDVVKVMFPKKSQFKLLVTVTASGTDAHHKKQPSYSIKKLAVFSKIEPEKIFVKNNQTLRRIFLSVLENNYDVLNLPKFSNLTDKTVCISGSKATPGSTDTMVKVSETRKGELEDLSDNLKLLKI